MNQGFHRSQNSPTGGEDLSGTGEGGGLQPPRMPKRVPCREVSCSSLLVLGSRKNLFLHKVEKWGFLEHPSFSPCFIEILGHFGNEEGKDSHSPGAEALWCSPCPLFNGKGKVLSPHWAPTCVPAAPCVQRLVEFLLWIFAEVFFGPSTAPRQDSSTMALEKTPVCFNLSFA